MSVAIISLGAMLVGCSGHDVADDTLPPIRTTTTSTPFSARASRFYVIRRGDSLTVIAAAHRTTVDAIMERNAIADPDDIRVGQVLELPPPSEPPTTAPASSPTTAP